jgi:nitrate/nitrite-specific signal transduction histidine kinase
MLLILFLLATPSVSQEVVIDSIKQTTLLDKKATIAQGNIVKQKETLEVLYNNSRSLNDSLFKQISFHKSENESLKLDVIEPLELKFNESKREYKFFKEKNDININALEEKLKQQKNIKWMWLGGGTLLGVILTLLMTVSI